MHWMRILLFMLGGFAIAAGCLLWVAQFFSGGGESTPVIWIESLREDARGEEEPFPGWKQESEEE